WLQLGKDGAWRKTELSPTPTTAIAAGWLGVKPARTRFLAAIKDQVLAYRQDKGKWQSQVVDEMFGEGAAIATADLNADSSDEIIAGQGRALSVYYANNHKWTKVPLDNGGIAAADCAVADLNGDGRPDIVCIGSTTANLRWY